MGWLSYGLDCCCLPLDKSNPNCDSWNPTVPFCCSPECPQRCRQADVPFFGHFPDKRQRWEKTGLEVGARISLQEWRKEERKKRKQAEREEETQSNKQKPSTKQVSAGTSVVTQSQPQPSRATPTAPRKSSSSRTSTEGASQPSQHSTRTAPSHSASQPVSQSASQQVSPLNQYAHRTTAFKRYRNPPPCPANARAQRTTLLRMYVSAGRAALSMPP